MADIEGKDCQCGSASERVARLSLTDSLTSSLYLEVPEALLNPADCAACLAIEDEYWKELAGVVQGRLQGLSEEEGLSVLDDLNSIQEEGRRKNVLLGCVSGSKETARFVAEHMDVIVLDNPQHRLEIGVACAKECVAAVLENIDGFRLLSEDRIYEFALACLSRDPYLVAERVGSFGFESTDRLLDIEMRCARQSEAGAHGVAKFFANFGRQHPADVIKVAHECAKNNWMDTAHYIANFGINDPQARYGVALLCLQHALSEDAAFVSYIPNFRLPDEQTATLRRMAVGEKV